MKKELIKKLDEALGFLHIKGFGAGRRIILMDCVMPIGKFNWGYVGDAPEQLAYHILYYVVGKSEAIKLKKSFMESVIAQLPMGSFDVHINIRSWLSIMKNGADGKFIHAYEFMDFKVREHYFSKFLDLPSFNCSLAVFENDTIEYDLIKNLTPKALNEWQEYITYKSTEKIKQEGENDVITQAGLVTEPNCYKVFNLLGNIDNTYRGNLKSLWT